jgi:hypothetical protein
VEKQPSMGEYLEGVEAFLLFDCQRFARAAGAAVDPELKRTPYRISKEIGVDESITRGIAREGWVPKKTDVLKRIEATYSSHPLWRPNHVLDIRPLGGPDGFVCRRLVSPEFSDVHSDIYQLWLDLDDEERFVFEASRDEDVTIVNCRDADPQNYFIIHYAPALKRLHGLDKTGVRFVDNRFPTYASAIIRDFGECFSSGEPMCRDVYRRYRRKTETIFFQNVTLPCAREGLIVSKTVVVTWNTGTALSGTR